ncbi:ribose-phosphate pyrophosphokinase [Buchnera aphidicola]|uniref:ribose-phosphate pyrophosphokinase n=1 Tax=Buchnera aphidicola TaxID=9 RepID=UPI0025435A09|nr:ribose-phosphate pyrophosphokinase [Buchnera aphidicola]WII23867.1 ribose-phosphate pyrophosphokinase [Buchnera aphidicola (Sipha maydis)]
MKLFSGNSIPRLAKSISKILNLNLGKATVNKFNDGEINVEINENVRGKDTFIIQSICTPSNDNLMELIVITDALKRSSAKRITAVIPYFGYSRQDKRAQSARVPITAKVIANILSNIGVDRVLTVDLHTEQIQGFFEIPIDNIIGSLVLLKDIIEKKLKNPIVVSPDIGGVIRARKIAKSLNDNIEMAIIDKRRNSKNISKVMNIIGNVKNKDCIIIDDMIDTGGTICNASHALKKQGAKNIFAYATHPVFSGNIYKNIKNSCLNEIIICDTIPLSQNIEISNIRVLTLAKILAQAIKRIHTEKSLSKIFKN